MVLVAVLVAAQVVGVVVPAWRAVVNSYCLLVLDLLGIAFGLAAARAGRHRTGWTLISAARVASIAANTGLGVATLNGSRGLWWFGAISGLMMYVLFAVGAVAFPAQRLRRRQRAALISEAVAVLGCGLIYIWTFVLQPHMRTADEWCRTWPISLGFPVGDLLLLIGVAAMLLRGGLNAADRPMGVFIAGMSMFVLADSAFNAIGDDGSHATGPLPATMSVIAAYLLMTLAAMWSSVTPKADRSMQRPLAAAWFSYIPYAAVVFGLGLMIAVVVHDDLIFVWGGFTLGIVVMTGGVTARQIISLRDSSDQQVIDPLTGLANREGLERHARRLLRREEPLAELFIDLDGFKSVNDAHGHTCGDLMLMEFAHILRSSIRHGDVAARIGGDEFVVLQRDVTGPADAVGLARRILAAAAARPLTFGEHTIVTRASIGIAVAAPGDTADNLRQHADVAMYQAKRTGQHGFEVYEPGMLDRRRDDDVLGRDLDDAVASGQFQVLYQPMINLATGRPVGAEALVRWHHPTRGLVPTLDFIPIAERTGAITDIGLHVLEQACRQARTWHQDGGDTPYVSVNLSPRQLQDPHLVTDVLGVLARSGLAAEHLVLEVTESAIVDDRIAIPTLQALRDRGIQIAIDDFGTGYSSLQYLTRLPVDILKIDRSFVAELTESDHGSAVTEAVIRLAQVLELRIVAEGIETTGQADGLLALGCDTGQGYLYAKPLPSEEAHAFITAVARTAEQHTSTRF